MLTEKVFSAAAVFTKVARLADNCSVVHQKRKDTDPKTGWQQVAFAIDVAQIPLHVLDLSLSFGSLAGIPKIAALDIAKISVLTANSVAELTQALLAKDRDKVIEVVIYRAVDLTQALYDSTFITGDARKVINILFPITFLAFHILQIGLAVGEDVTIERVDGWIARDWGAWKSRIERVLEKDFDDFPPVKAIDSWIFKNWTPIKNGLIERRSKRIQLKETLPAVKEQATKVDQQIKDEFREVIDWKNLKKIPRLLLGEEILQPFRCPQTNTLIRFAVMPRGAEGVFYDRDAIENWITGHPNTAPENWPKDLEVSVDNLVPHASVQCFLDKALEILSKKYHHELQIRKGKAPSNQTETTSQADALSLKDKVGILNDLGNLKAIPDWLVNPTLALILCKQSGKPIRFAVRPALGAKPDVIYDRKELLDWSRSHPGEEPKDWPITVVFSVGYTVKNPGIQVLIDNALTFEAEKYQWNLSVAESHDGNAATTLFTPSNPLDLSRVKSLAHGWIWFENSKHDEMGFGVLYRAPIILYQKEGIIRLNLHLFVDNYFMQKFILKTLDKLLQQNPNLKVLCLHEKYLLTNCPREWHLGKIDKFIDDLNDLIATYPLERIELYPDSSTGLTLHLAEKLDASEMTLSLPEDEEVCNLYIDKIDGRENLPLTVTIQAPHQIYQKVRKKLQHIPSIMIDKKKAKDLKELSLTSPQDLRDKIEQLNSVFDGEIPDGLNLGNISVSAEMQKEMEAILSAHPQIKASFNPPVDSPSEAETMELLNKDNPSPAEIKQLVVTLKLVPDIKRRLAFFEQLLYKCNDISRASFFKMRRQAEQKAESKEKIPVAVYQHIFYEKLLQEGEIAVLSDEPTGAEIDQHIQWLMRDPDAKERLETFQKHVKRMMRINGTISHTEVSEKINELNGLFSWFPKTYIDRSVFIKLLQDIRGPNDFTKIGDHSSKHEVFAHVKWLLLTEPKVKEFLEKVIQLLEMKSSELKSEFRFGTIIRNIKESFKPPIDLYPRIYKELYADFERRRSPDTTNIYLLVKEHTAVTFPLTQFIENFFV